MLGVYRQTDNQISDWFGCVGIYLPIHKHIYFCNLGKRGLQVVQ